MEWQIKRLEITRVIFKISEKSFMKEIKKITEPNLQLNKC
jgi:hypothetical protein